MLDGLLSSVDTTTILTFGVALSIAAFILKPGQKNYNLPPYPWLTVPIIGNVLSLLWIKDKGFVKFYKTSKKPQYRKLFMIKIGARNICILNDIDVVREALVKRPTDFAGRPNFYSGEMLTGNKDIVFTNYSPVWRFHRKVAHQAMRNFASGDVLEKILHKSCNTAIEAMETKGSKPFVLKPYVELLVFNIVSGICFGSQYEFEDPDFKKFCSLTSDFFDALGNGLPADVFPWLGFLPFQGHKTKKLSKIFTDMLDEELVRHKQNLDPENPQDMMDYLLLTQKTAEEEETDMKGVLTDFHLKMTIFDIFGAGLDTINATLQSCIANCILYPEAQQTVYEELENVIGDRVPVGSDRTNLPHMEAFLCEVMRNNTFAVLGVPLATTCDTTVGGYELPKDTMVIINFWALHNDEDRWDEPSAFRPERFLNDAGQLGPRPVSFMPFSAGKRVCLGENLAKAELTVILPMLLQKFKFSGPENFKYEMEDNGLANVPKPYTAILEKRI